MVKRVLIGVAPLLSLMAGALVIAPPAAASVTACGPWEVAVSNSHGRLEVQSCIRHTPGAYGSLGRYACFEWGLLNGQPCNVVGRAAGG